MINATPIVVRVTLSLFREPMIAESMVRRKVKACSKYMTQIMRWVNCVPLRLAGDEQAQGDGADQEQMFDVQVDIKPFSMFLAGDQFHPARAVCSEYLPANPSHPVFGANSPDMSVSSTGCWQPLQTSGVGTSAL